MPSYEDLSDEDYLDPIIVIPEQATVHSKNTLTTPSENKPATVIDLTDSDPDVGTATDTQADGKVPAAEPSTIDDIPRNEGLLKECNPLQIKIVDYVKHPWYKKIYKNNDNENTESDIIIIDDVDTDNIVNPLSEVNKELNFEDIVVTPVTEMNVQTSPRSDTAKVKIRPVHIEPYIEGRHSDKCNIRPEKKVQPPKQRDIKKKKTVVSDNKPQIDFKKNQGLVGLRVIRSTELPNVLSDKEKIEPKSHRSEEKRSSKPKCCTENKKPDFLNKRDTCISEHVQKPKEATASRDVRLDPKHKCDSQVDKGIFPQKIQSKLHKSDFIKTPTKDRKKAQKHLKDTFRDTLSLFNKTKHALLKHKGSHAREESESKVKEGNESKVREESKSNKQRKENEDLNDSPCTTITTGSDITKLTDKAAKGSNEPKIHRQVLFKSMPEIDIDDFNPMIKTYSHNEKSGNLLNIGKNKTNDEQILSIGKTAGENKTRKNKHSKDDHKKQNMDGVTKATGKNNAFMTNNVGNPDEMKGKLALHKLPQQISRDKYRKHNSGERNKDHNSTNNVCNEHSSVETTVPLSVPSPHAETQKNYKAQCGVPARNTTEPNERYKLEAAKDNNESDNTTLIPPKPEPITAQQTDSVNHLNNKTRLPLPMQSFTPNTNTGISSDQTDVKPGLSCTKRDIDEIKNIATEILKSCHPHAINASLNSNNNEPNVRTGNFKQPVQYRTDNNSQAQGRSMSTHVFDRDPQRTGNVQPTYVPAVRLQHPISKYIRCAPLYATPPQNMPENAMPHQFDTRYNDNQSLLFWNYITPLSQFQYNNATAVPPPPPPPPKTSDPSIKNKYNGGKAPTNFTDAKLGKGNHYSNSTASKISGHQALNTKIDPEPHLSNIHQYSTIVGRNSLGIVPPPPPKTSDGPTLEGRYGHDMVQPPNIYNDPSLQGTNRQGVVSLDPSLQRRNSYGMVHPPPHVYSGSQLQRRYSHDMVPNLPPNTSMDQTLQEKISYGMVPHPPANISDDPKLQGRNSSGIVPPPPPNTYMESMLQWINSYGMVPYHPMNISTGIMPQRRNSLVVPPPPPTNTPMDPTLQGRYSHGMLLPPPPPCISNDPRNNRVIPHSIANPPEGYALGDKNNNGMIPPSLPNISDGATLAGRNNHDIASAPPLPNDPIITTNERMPLPPKIYDEKITTQNNNTATSSASVIVVKDRRVEPTSPRVGSTIIGENVTGVIRAINITSAPVPATFTSKPENQVKPRISDDAPVYSKSEMLEELSKEMCNVPDIEDPVLEDFNKPPPNAVNLERKRLYEDADKPGPLSKKPNFVKPGPLSSKTSNYADYTPKPSYCRTNLATVRNKGYSPPILPIPIRTYEEPTEISGQGDCYDMNTPSSSYYSTMDVHEKNECQQEHMSNENLRKRKIDFDIQQEKAVKKISLEEYKKKISVDDYKKRVTKEDDRNGDCLGKVAIKSECDVDNSKELDVGHCFKIIKEENAGTANCTDNLQQHSTEKVRVKTEYDVDLSKGDRRQSADVDLGYDSDSTVKL